MVYFVGAGCGAADLITVRGKALLERADTVIYAGSLINPELLDYCRKGTRLCNSARMTLEEVLAVMEETEKAGGTTVRLHSGEPSMYSAEREQMDVLDARGIAYATCPGVSACFGAAASLNVEYTLPDVSQTLIITRMAGRTAVPAAEDMKALASHHASMAIYLSSGLTDKVQEALLRGGYPEETPCAIVYRASWADEAAYFCTVGTLHQCAKEHQIRNTAVILVGEAIAHTHYSRSRLYAPDFETGWRKAVRL